MSVAWRAVTARTGSGLLNGIRTKNDVVSEQPFNIHGIKGAPPPTILANDLDLPPFLQRFPCLSFANNLKYVLGLAR